MILTVYRALYRDVSTTTNVEHSLCGMYYVTCIHITSADMDFDSLDILRKRSQSSQEEECITKRPRTESLLGM